MNKKLDIIYEDKDLLVINKKHSLLTVSTEKEKEKTLYREVSAYLKQKYGKNRCFVVHRLDKGTSGIIIFAKSMEIKELLQNNWENLVSLREYIGIVEGIPNPKEAKLKDYLAENKMYKVYVSNKENGKLAITKYRVISSNNGLSLVVFQLETGRKNQIRAQMENFKHPILGDRKYGSNKNPIRRMALHANKLSLIHPRTKELLEFETSVPNSFVKLMGL